MLTLIIVLWYICTFSFLAYALVCGAYIFILEKKTITKRGDLALAFEELSRSVFPNTALDKNDIAGLLDFYQIACKLRNDAIGNFDFYVKKERVEKLADEYNAAARKYNELIDGFPVCVIATILGKEKISVFEY